MKKLFISLLLLSIMLDACKKPYPAAEMETPVFYFKGKMNGAAKTISAGLNQYYMFTSYDDITTSGQHFYVFEGHLKVASCANCESIDIQCFDASTRTETSIANVPTILPVGDYSILQLATVTNEIKYHFSAVSGYQLYNWNFDDGTSSNEQQPIHIFSGNGTYNVCFTAVDTLNGCTLTSCNTITVSQSPEYDLTFDYQVQQQNIILSLPPSGWTPISWTLNDTLISSGFLATASLNPNTLNTLHACVTASKNNVTKTFCRMLEVPGYTSCSADWTYVSSLDSTSSSDYFSKIRISYTAPGGVIYVSDKLNQPLGSFFKIVEKSDYLMNENQQATKKLRLAFKVTLFRTDNPTESVVLETDDCVWGVALP